MKNLINSVIFEKAFIFILKIPRVNLFCNLSSSACNRLLSESTFRILLSSSMASGSVFFLINHKLVKSEKQKWEIFEKFEISYQFYNFNWVYNWMDKIALSVDGVLFFFLSKRVF